MIGKFWEDTCNASGNKLISLVAGNGRQLVSEPEWTRVRRLDQKSVIRFMDKQIMAVLDSRYRVF